jgi:hypothetical protein
MGKTGYVTKGKPYGDWIHLSTESVTPKSADGGMGITKIKAYRSGDVPPRRSWEGHLELNVAADQGKHETCFLPLRLFFLEFY